MSIGWPGQLVVPAAEPQEVRAVGVATPSRRFATGTTSCPGHPRNPPKPQLRYSYQLIFMLDLLIWNLKFPISDQGQSARVKESPYHRANGSAGRPGPSSGAGSPRGPGGGPASGRRDIRGLDGGSCGRSPTARPGGGARRRGRPGRRGRRATAARPPRTRRPGPSRRRRRGTDSTRPAGRPGPRRPRAKARSPSPRRARVEARPSRISSRAVPSAASIPRSHAATASPRRSRATRASAWPQAEFRRTCRAGRSSGWRSRTALAAATERSNQPSARANSLRRSRVFPSFPQAEASVDR